MDEELMDLEKILLGIFSITQLEKKAVGCK